MKIGIDFDNTIACYTGVFYQAALEWKLIPDSLGHSKGSVRDYLRSIGQEDEWTKLQGYVYGSRMDLAEPFPGVADFFKHCKAAGITTVIISHKTKHPYIGPKYDLHEAAKQWLSTQSFSPHAAFFELTLKDKLSRIGSLKCDYFIDDLPELLAEPIFPNSVKKILFDPLDVHPDVADVIRVTSWKQISQVIA